MLLFKYIQFRAVTSKPEYLTTEKFEAVLGGFGAFNLGVWAASNVIERSSTIPIT
ncbi:hypothetical protein [Sporomusa rhizae]|uniref:hypothetical protein n=1 Tax=Sporomusa rhizae TaxID=357999 RepID=UPI00352B2CFD